MSMMILLSNRATALTVSSMATSNVIELVGGTIADLTRSLRCPSACFPSSQSSSKKPPLAQPGGRARKREAVRRESLRDQHRSYSLA